MEDDSIKDMPDWKRAYAEGNHKLGDELADMDFDEAMLEYGELCSQTDAGFAELEAHLRGAVPAEIDMDAPLTIEQALNLTEVGGSYTVNPELRSASESVKEKTLRGAIEVYRNGGKGGLRFGWLNGKNIYTTRRWVIEWRDSKCREDARNRTSSSGRPAGTSRGGSPTTQPGSSRTETLRLAQAAARESMKRRS